MKREQYNQAGKLFLVTLIFLASTTFTLAQVAQGGNYRLEQSVIVGGGGTSADSMNNTYSITGSIGQAIAGSGVSNSTYKVQSGFFTAAPLAPTAATVIIGGRVTNLSGGAIANIAISITDTGGNIRTTKTDSSGYYNFSDVAAGGTYIVTATGKRFSFAQSTQVVNVNDDAMDVNFIGIPAKRLGNFE